MNRLRHCVIDTPRQGTILPFAHHRFCLIQGLFFVQVKFIKNCVAGQFLLLTVSLPSITVQPQHGLDVKPAAAGNTAGNMVYSYQVGMPKAGPLTSRIWQGFFLVHVSRILGSFLPQVSVVFPPGKVSCIFATLGCTCWLTKTPTEQFRKPG